MERVDLVKMVLQDLKEQEQAPLHEKSAPASKERGVSFPMCNLHRTDSGVVSLEPCARFSVPGCFTSPESIDTFCRGQLFLQKRVEEYLYVIALGAKGRPLMISEVSHGTVNGSFSSPRDIFSRCLLAGASGFVLVHNHPSGDCSPSKEDLKTMEVIKKAAELMELDFVDSLIVGRETFSFRSQQII